jgi:predicted dienelactone hydrolase
LMRLPLILLFGLIVSCSDLHQHEFTDHIVVDDLRARTIEYRVWSPDTLPAEKSPLVLISHGSGGEFSNHRWLIDTLLEHGYIVAALNHPFNTTRNNTPAGVVAVWQRPADVSLVLTDLLQNPVRSEAIDKTRIGVAGFSSGGYTAIALAGAIFNPTLMAEYCTGVDHGPDCALGNSAVGVDYTRASDSYRDPRIRSVFAMAPAVGSGISIASLNEVEVPVFITASRDDELVYPRFGAERYAQHIPSATLSLIPTGGHFVFLECNLVTWAADQFIDEFDLCGSQFEVNQDEVRETVSNQAIDFFDLTLNQPNSDE